MEIACPSCGQRLNVRAGLTNPTCRCPGCKHVFRAVEFGYDPSPQPEEPNWSFDRPADQPSAAQRTPPTQPIQAFEVPDDPPPEVIRPKPSPSKSPFKLGIGTLIFILIIVFKIVSRLMHNGPPAKNQRPRNDLRPAIPVRQMQSLFERQPREIRVDPRAELPANTIPNPEWVIL